MLRNAREKNNLTQGDVSKRLGITQAAVSQYEAGKRNLSLLALIELVNALDCSLLVKIKNEADD